MKNVFILTCLILVSCKSYSQHEQLDEEMQAIGKSLCDNLLNRPNFMMYETDFLHAIHYAEVCAAYGAAQYALNTSDTMLMNNLIDRYEPIIQDSIFWQNHHVDGNVAGILPFEFYKFTKDSSYLQQGLYLSDTQWKDTLSNGLTTQARYWVDDVFMVASLQTEAFKATGKQKYLDRSAKITLAYIDSLQQENGLFHHGPKAPIYWGRGNGWMAAGMAITLSSLPKEHKHYNNIRSGYVKMMNALLNYQSANGLWRQVIDLPEAWDETSCSAMFAYAMSVGVNTDILKEHEFEPAIEKAWAALKQQVNEEGELMNVCAGTGQSNKVDYYLNRPRITGDFHGQAPLLWLINSMISMK